MPIDIPRTLKQAIAHHQANRVAQAEELYRQILAVQPTNVDAALYLGVLGTQIGRYDDAILFIKHAISLNRNYPLAWYNLGNALIKKGDIDAGIDAYKEALTMKPEYPEVLNNLGHAYNLKMRLDQSIPVLEKAARLRPDWLMAQYNLGRTAMKKGEYDIALPALRQATALADKLPPHARLLEDAVDSDDDNPLASISARPTNHSNRAKLYSHIAYICIRTGLIDEAITALRRAVELDPAATNTHSGLIQAFVYHPAHTPRQLFEENKKWNDQHAVPLASMIRPHTNNPDPNRPIRVGYVSPDFFVHPVGRFLLPLLENHSDDVEVFCYSLLAKVDDTTRRLQAQADTWRDVHHLGEQQIAAIVRSDDIDILVDLAMHTASNKILLFAHKPAPVQLTWLAYPGSTGMTTIDYRVSDPYLDPPGTDESVYSEKTVRLPDCYWCYQALPETPAVSPSPAAAKGHVTFVCLNNFSKVSPPALETWARIMSAVEGSRLLLLAPSGKTRERVLGVFARHGVAADRIDFTDIVPMPEYFASFERVDIALDPFPFVGGTTTCDALYMGVPVITLAGKTPIGRGGVSVLSNVGLPEFIAQSEDQYVDIAVKLARDLPRLAELRGSLRGKMTASPLMDAPRFAKNMEAIYRNAWREWCAAHPKPEAS